MPAGATPADRSCRLTAIRVVHGVFKEDISDLEVNDLLAAATSKNQSEDDGSVAEADGGVRKDFKNATNLVGTEATGHAWNGPWPLDCVAGV